ncbi:uncharacterized membrane protein YcaP (DUF421 family) [Brevibacillus sp. AG162]|uniref:DUF421 domain-containing protein n=1 Tax=Brevibacillus sp. AG162 TaxID=2572910 RepID=UPI001150B707|nr:DUF421 domain-containing protein [Brevibacillus sp. AG162]TQK53408.1 uncharacterized membrane protein YcaP (DUF421 family) [Brevibacillus sp. AG162]
MSWILIMQTVGVIVFGTLLLRIAGRKSISQMTMAQVVVMIGIGTLLIQPISGHGYWPTFVLALVLVIGMIAIEYLGVKSNLFESIITGKAVLVIENGQLLIENMRKLRLSTDKLEMRLRQAGISSISDVEWATIEVSGNLGYQLKSDKQPATKEDIQKLIHFIENRIPMVRRDLTVEDNIFSEIKYGHQTTHSDNLQ